jgi:hypothetical protein
MGLRSAGLSAIAIISLAIPFRPVLAATVSGVRAGPGPRVASGRTVKGRPNDSKSCFGAGPNSFVGGPDLNTAVGTDTAVLGGGSNFVCDDYGGVGAGQNNQVSSNGSDTGQNSFIAGGTGNKITAEADFIGAGSGNQISGNDSAIAGGYQNNITSTPDGFIGGGETNVLNTVEYANIGGGYDNTISGYGNSQLQNGGGYFGTIGGGAKNVISPLAASGGAYGTIGGGLGNTLNGEYAVIGGGSTNVASGYLATIPGGYRNVAAGETSFAAGYGSDALTAGSFVWSDYNPSAAHVVAKKPNQFLARATGGVAFYSNAAQTAGVSLAPGSGTWSSLSDRNMKTGIVPVDDARILSKLDTLPVSEWSYISERGVRHIGPMAQDFYAAFRVGEDDRHITSIDEDGVALAAAKALHAENDDLGVRVATLERRAALIERALAAGNR